MELAFTNVSKAYGGDRVISHLSCVFADGIHVVSAANGQGKTTFLELAAGVSGVTWGRVTVNGVDRRRPEVKRAFRSAYCPTHPTFYDGATVGDAVRIYRYLHGAPQAGAGFGEFDPFGLAARRDVRFGELSFGWKKRVLLHMVFCIDPGLLALDEPTVGLDDEARFVLGKLIRARGQNGITLMSSNEEMTQLSGEAKLYRLISTAAGKDRQTEIRVVDGFVVRGEGQTRHPV